ncbi:MAG TPA: GNAT family N-acetyltransferase [bacterium]
MRIMPDEARVRHDERDRRFVLALPEGEAELAYRLDGKVAEFYHTFVPPEARGRGAAEEVCGAAFEHAGQAGWRVIPSCPYVSGTYLKRHPEFLELTQRTSD